MPDARLTIGVVVMALISPLSSAFGSEAPDPALLEFLGSTARIESDDVDRLVDARLADTARDDRADARKGDESDGSDG